MINRFLLLAITLLLNGCPINVEADMSEIEIPPVEYNTELQINMSEELNENDCEFQIMPEYPEGFISSCVINCCTWIFPESTGACEERWCLDLDTGCGWSLDSWACYRI